MATSRSNSQTEKWVAGAFLYSGRLDPTWTIPHSVVQRLLKIWDSLQSWVGRVPSPPPLGYRGCFVRGLGDREWQAYGGAVTLVEGGRQESRRDGDRKFEKSVLASAPGGTLPPSFLEKVF
jgi:hypothetical protein